MGKITMIGCSMTNVGVGLSMPGGDGHEAAIIDTTFDRVGKAVEMRDPVSLRAQLGLAENVSAADMRSFFQLLRSGAMPELAAEKSGLARFVKPGLKAADVALNLANLATKLPDVWPKVISVIAGNPML